MQNRLILRTTLVVAASAPLAAVTASRLRAAVRLADDTSANLQYSCSSYGCLGGPYSCATIIYPDHPPVTCTKN